MMILFIRLNIYKQCWSWISLEFQEEKSKVSSINKNLFKTYYDKIKAYKLLLQIMIIQLYCKIFKHSYKRNFANLIINAWFCSLVLDIHRSFLRIYITSWPRIEKKIDLYINVQIWLLLICLSVNNVTFKKHIINCSNIHNDE